MRKQKTTKSRDAGSVMLVVMLLSAILMLASAAMGVIASNAIFRMRRLMVTSQALHIAEAGVADMIGRLSENYLAWERSTNTASFAGGTYRVVTTPTVGNGVIVTSVGEIGSQTRVASVELLGTERNRNDSLFALDGAILADGEVRFRTAAFTIRGNVHSNQRITSATGAQNGDFYANITNNAPGSITSVSTIGDLKGTHFPGSPVREIPAFNLDSYRELALNGGIFYQGNQTLKGWHGRPANGIVYVNGNVTISNNSSLVGTVVATGDITIENNFAHTAFSAGMPAFLTNGNLKLDNRGRINGLVYAGGNVLIANNVDIIGGIISRGYTDINNHTDIYHASAMPDWDPLQPSVPPEVIIGGWVR
jgi:hypothetical protein